MTIELSEYVIDAIAGAVVKKMQEPSYNSIKTELEPCDDCISRQAVLDLVADYDLSMGQVVKGIHALSPVSPQPKMGLWIDIMVGDMPAQACDQCKTFYPLAYTGGGHKYCPNCGAKMQRWKDE